MILDTQHKTKSCSIFQEVSEDLVECLRFKNEKLEPFFLFPTKHISDEAALLGEAVSHLNNSQILAPTVFRTFFCNSYMEAFNGTVKIMRHHAYLRSQSSNGHILIYDPTSNFQKFYNPLGEIASRALVPGLFFVDNLEQAENYLTSKERFIGFICLANDGTPIKAVDRLFSICKRRRVFSGYGTGFFENWYDAYENPYIFASWPDVFLYGENLAERQIPFGCFSMTKDMYKPWDSVSSCLLHSSTFSGNTLALKFVLSLLMKYKICDFKSLELTNNERFAKYGEFVNPKVSLLYRSLSLSPKAKTAQGAKVLFQDGDTTKEVIDFVAGSGSALRGHNPSDLAEEVLEKHDRSKDYWLELETKIAEQTHFKYAFPAVSGSSAVDIAVILSILASTPKTRIITFKESYSGKSLIALNMSRIEEYRRPFQPLYFDVIEVDPFTLSGKEQLAKELESGLVALVWFEIVQGESLQRIPDEVLQLLEDKRKKFSFLIGIDEILSGMFRTGSFLAYQQYPIIPDIVSIGKGLSDMTFPISATLVTEGLYEKARKTNKDLVDRLKTYYLNQMGAHISLHALSWCFNHNIAQHVETCGRKIRQVLGKAVEHSTLFQELRGDGLFFYLKLNENVFPVNWFGEYSIEFALSSKCLNRLDVLIMNSRFTPPLVITEEELNSACLRLKQLVTCQSRIGLALFSLKSFARFYFYSIMRFIGL